MSEARRQPWLTRRWPCRFGLHRWFRNTWGEPVGSPQYGLTVLHSEWRCNYCDVTREAR